MAEEGKKISFGFSKLKKPSNLIKPVEVEKVQIDYVDSFDGVRGKFSYKGNVKCDEVIKKELVIPLIGTKTAFEVIKAKLEAINDDIEKNNSEQTINNEDKMVHIKEEPKATKEVSIDDLAAKEILNDLQNNVLEEKSKNSMVIKQPSQTKNEGNEKDIPIDYENIPVTDFGLAMLRGMGWTPQTGIGKDSKVVQVVTPKLRPKGLGLGADKVALQKTNQDTDLTIAIKGYVKFLSGPNKGSYGQVEAMDENNGRVIVKLALGGTVSVSELLLSPVTRKDYEKNSKVINRTKYEEFSEIREPAKKNSGKDVDSEKNEKSNRHRKEKYDRRNSYSSDDDDYRRRKKSRSSSPDERSSHKKKKKSRDDYRSHKHKKTKKKKERKKYSSESSGDSSSDEEYRRKSSKSHSHRSGHSSHKRT